MCALVGVAGKNGHKSSITTPTILRTLRSWFQVFGRNSRIQRTEGGRRLQPRTEEVWLLRDVTEGDTRLKAEMEGALWFPHLFGAEKVERLKAGMEGARGIQEGDELLLVRRKFSFFRLGRTEVNGSSF